MSDVARSMYLNYKPPFTSFRMNLNPANLGSISIIMRASKSENSISVSMNMSNNATMEIFAENRSSLQSALQKQLGDSSSVSLNFNMQGDSSNSTFEQFNQDSKQKDTHRNIETKNTNTVEEQEVIEAVDYM
jgi:hypothetical protein